MFLKNEQVEDWQDLQNKVMLLFREMDYHAESPCTIPLAGRGKKEVDVYVEDRNASVTTRIIIECKWWNQTVPQDVVHSFHSVLTGSGANTGFIISKLPFQAGAKEAAQFTSISLLTFEEFQHAYGNEWFRRRMAKLDAPAKELREIHRLHFDHGNMLGFYNNKIFHTPDLIERLLRANRWIVNLTLQHRAIEPSTYLGPEPVKMATDPLRPFNDPPAGSFWHFAPTVRDYFNIMDRAMAECLAEWKSLESEARKSFEDLGEESQDLSFARVLQAMREESPVRVLKPLLPEAEYQRLLHLLAGRGKPPTPPAQRPESPAPPPESRPGTPP